MDDPNPPPKAVDADELNALLSGLPYLPTATAFLLSARLYSEAMEIIEERPEIAYLLLVASAEAIASAELAEWEPDDTEKIKAKGDIVAEGRRLGLDNTNAKSLALVAVKDNAWIRRKFLKFLTEHVDEQLLKSRDELYIDTKGLFGPKGSFSEALSAIYSARGAALHGGRRYGPSVGVGTSAWIPVDATTEVLTGQVGVPPVTWFERVVNLALCTYLQRSVQHR